MEDANGAAALPSGHSMSGPMLVPFGATLTVKRKPVSVRLVIVSSLALNQ